MNQKLDKYLVKKCPTLFADRYKSMRETCMCWGFDCGDGWYDLLKEACFALEPIMAALKAKDPEGWSFGYYRASQIKEKYGTLRFYLSGNTPETDAIIDKAERRSSVTCEQCGKPGKMRGRGWLYTACNRHTKKEDK
jgi:hypothetical protein